MTVSGGSILTAEGLEARLGVARLSMDRTFHLNALDQIAASHELLRERLADAERHRDAARRAGRSLRKQLLSRVDAAEARAAAGSRAAQALQRIADPTNHHHKPGWVPPEKIAAEALAEFRRAEAGGDE